MESFDAPRGLRTLAHAAFANCANLKKVELNEGLETLGTQGATGRGVFAGCALNTL